MNVHTTIIVAYNKDRGWLSQALKSAYSQPNCLVVESCSEMTVGHNINVILEHVTTPYWCLLDEDDLLTEDSVANRVFTIEQTGADFVHARAVNLWDTGEKTPYTLTNPHTTFDTCLNRNGIFGSSCLYRTSLRDKFGLWDAELWTGEELEWHLRILKGGAKIAFCDAVVYEYRRHLSQKSLGIGVDQMARKKAINEIKLKYAK